MPERFFIVGAQRCGTTYLYHLLAAHPEIEMATPVRPEPKFFFRESLFRKGVDFYDATYFGKKPRALLRGEKSTSYLESPSSQERIIRTFPSAKALILLRNPIDRAVSNYWFSVNSGVETLSIWEAFTREDERRKHFDSSRFSVSPYAYLSRGYYVERIRTLETIFDPSNVKVVLYEDLVEREHTYSDIQKFLGVTNAPRAKPQPEIMNTSRRSGDGLDASQRKSLAALFANANRELGLHLGRDLAVWT